MSNPQSLPVPTPTILRELRGADEGGNLETVFGALLGGSEAGLGFGCLQLLFFHLCLGPRQGQVELRVFHFLVISLEGSMLGRPKEGTASHTPMKTVLFWHEK